MRSRVGLADASTPEIVIVGSDTGHRERPRSRLLPTTMPVAPASWAFFDLDVKAHVPRSTIAKLPETAAPFVSGVQPSVVPGPAAVGRVQTQHDVVGEAGVRQDRPERSRAGGAGLAMLGRAVDDHAGRARGVLEHWPTASLRVDVTLVPVHAAVDQVDGLAPDVGVGLVEGSRLPLVDAVPGVLV